MKINDLNLTEATAEIDAPSKILGPDGKPLSKSKPSQFSPNYDNTVKKGTVTKAEPNFTTKGERIPPQIEKQIAADAEKAAAKTATKDAAKAALKTGGKFAAGRAAKLVPGIAAAYGAYDAYDRAKKGDYVGAGLAGLGGVAATVAPGPGTGIAGGLDAINLARDLTRDKSEKQPTKAKSLSDMMGKEMDADKKSDKKSDELSTQSGKEVDDEIANLRKDNDAIEKKPTDKPAADKPSAKTTPSTQKSDYKGSAAAREIQAANPDTIKDVNKIRAGDTIKVGDEDYKIQRGDTLDRIAKNAGVRRPSILPPDTISDLVNRTRSNIDSMDTRSNQSDAETARLQRQNDATDDTASDEPVKKSSKPGEYELSDKGLLGGDIKYRQDDSGRKFVPGKANPFDRNPPEQRYYSGDDVKQGFKNLFNMNESAEDNLLNKIKHLSDISESKTQDNNMDFRQLLAIMSETKMADIKGKKHTGKYGTEHDTDEEGESKKRGGQESEATKDAKKWQGAADAAKLISGGKKSSLKDWVESTEEMLAEKAVSKNQQQFMGMVHAAQKGKKPASAAVAKAAKGMTKKAATDFASTKHKGLPEKVKESEEAVEEELKGGQKKLDKNKNGKLDSQDFKMLRKEKVKEGINFQEMVTEKQLKVDEMLEELQQEIAEFKATGHMGDKLRDALDVHSYSKGETLIGEEDDAIGDEIRHGQDVQRDKDMARSDLHHAQDMSRLGAEAGADLRHSKDVADLHDQSTADLWRMQDLARDKAMSSPSQKSNGQTFPLKSELDENPFSYAAKQAKEHGDKSFSLGGKTFPVKEASKSYTDDMGPASGWTDEEMKAMDRQATKAQEVNRKESERQAKNVWDPSMGSPKTPGDPVGLPKKSVKESMVYDVWNHQLEKIINESLTVSTTQSDHGDDSVSVTASGEDAADILALLRNAGLGGMGPTEHQEEPEQQFSNYGVPISSEHHHPSIADHGKPAAEVEVISAGDEMAELMQALSSIEGEEGHGEDSHDYADEESNEDSEEMCQECGVYESSCECDESHEMVDEEDEQPAGATAPSGQAAMSYAGNQAGASSAPASTPPSSDVEQAKTGIAAGSPAIAGAAQSDNMQNAAATMKAGQSGASPTAAAQTGVAAADQAQKQASQNKSGSEMGAGYAKAASGPANPAASNAAMSAMTGGASTPKADSTAAMPASQSTAAAPAKQEYTTVGQNPMNRQGTQVAKYNSFGDFFNKVTGKGNAPAATAAAPAASSGAAAAMASKSAGPATKTPAGQVMAEEEVDENLESARPVEEDLANSEDDRATQDIDFMTKVISGGLNKEKVQRKHGYQFADNPLAMHESVNTADSANDLLQDYRKLSGLE